MCMDEVHKEFVANTTVVWLVEAISNRVFEILATDVVKMALEEAH